jgi:hypothetical protein
MRTTLIRLIILAVILLAGIQPGAPLNPDPEPVIAFAATATSTLSPSATTELPSATPEPPTPTVAITPAATSPVEQESDIRFAVIGDYGFAGKDEERVANLIKDWEPDFIITTGDNNYSVGAAVTIDRNIGQYFHEYIYPYVGEYGEGADINRFFPSLGNHDWQSRNAEPYLEYFELPGNERYYDFIWGPVHFFAVDSDPNEPDGFRANSRQAAWLRSALAASSSTWKIVYMHHSPYSSGSRGIADELRWPYQEWGADAVLSGHNHIYERIILDGFPYFINGLGGLSRYEFEEITEGSEVRYNERFGAMYVQANEERITFEFHALNGNRSILIDSYTITR